VVAALDAGDARGHLALADDGVRAVVGDGGAKRSVEPSNPALAWDLDAGESMALERLLDRVPCEVLRRVTGDGSKKAIEA